MIEIGVGGRYKLKKYKQKSPGSISEIGELVEETEWFSNIFTDLGMDAFGIGFNRSGGFVGTGNTAPATTDTSLATYLATSNSVSRNFGEGNDGSAYVRHTSTFVFNAGVATGILSEVGVAIDPNPGSENALVSRALILDGGGSPTTLTKLADEILHVVYEFRTYPPEIDFTGNLVDPKTSISYAWTARTKNINAWHDNSNTAGLSATGGTINAANEGGLVPVDSTAYPSGATQYNIATSIAAYVNGTYTKKYTFNASLNQANFAAGIGSVQFGIASNLGSASVQVAFVPSIMKTSSDVLSVDLDISWTRKTI